MIRTSFALVLVTLFSLSYTGAARAGEAADKTYVVGRGQTLSVIAHDVLGDPRLWPAIYRANRDQIKDPTVLHVGQRLSIPDVALDPAIRERIRAEAVAWMAPARKPEGPDVAAAPPATGPTLTSE